MEKNNSTSPTLVDLINRAARKGGKNLVTADAYKIVDAVMDIRPNLDRDLVSGLFDQMRRAFRREIVTRWQTPTHRQEEARRRAKAHPGQRTQKRRRIYY